MAQFGGIMKEAEEFKRHKFTLYLSFVFCQILAQLFILSVPFIFALLKIITGCESRPSSLRANKKIVQTFPLNRITLRPVKTIITSRIKIIKPIVSSKIE